jgi:hypothetical protein
VPGLAAKGLFGAPLPPPQPPSASSPASAHNARVGRSQLLFITFDAMEKSLMMMS